MAIIKQVWNAILARGGSTPAEGELSVVREDRNADILFSVVETQGAVRHRTTFSLSVTQAIGLARFLAGVAALKKDDEEEELTPTKTGAE